MSEDPKMREVAIPVGMTDDGHPKLLRVLGDDTGPKEATLGVLYPLAEGMPLPPGADLLQVRPCNGHLHVKTVYESPDAPASGSGWKAMGVSKEKFAANWDAIFARDEDADEALDSSPAPDGEWVN